MRKHPARSFVAMGAQIVLIAICGCGAPQIVDIVEPPPGAHDEAVSAYLWGPCSSPDPTGYESCAEGASRDLTLSVALQLAPETESVAATMWREVIAPSRGDLERCHRRAARLDPTMTCTVTLVTTGDAGAPLFELDATRTDCSSALTACAASALSGTSEQALHILRSAEPGTLSLYFAAPRIDPRSHP